MIDSEVRNMNPLVRKSISRNERSQFIFKKHITMTKQSKAQDCPSRIVGCWQILLTHRGLTTHSVCVVVAGTQRLFLANVAKYCSISKDINHNELCKWLNKNGPPKNFTKRGSYQLFLYHERKKQSFCKDESNKYSYKSGALFHEYFW